MTKDELATLKPGDKIVVSGDDRFFIGANIEGNTVAYEDFHGFVHVTWAGNISIPKVKKYLWVMQWGKGFKAEFKVCAQRYATKEDVDDACGPHWKAIYQIPESEE